MRMELLRNYWPDREREGETMTAMKRHTEIPKKGKEKVAKNAQKKHYHTHGSRAILGYASCSSTSFLQVLSKRRRKKTIFNIILHKLHNDAIQNFTQVRRSAIHGFVVLCFK